MKNLAISCIYSYVSYVSAVSSAAAGEKYQIAWTKVSFGNISSDFRLRCRCARQIDAIFGENVFGKGRAVKISGSRSGCAELITGTQIVFTEINNLLSSRGRRHGCSSNGCCRAPVTISVLRPIVVHIPTTIACLNHCCFFML